MNIRVTDQVQTGNAIANIRQQSSALAVYQNQVSTGLRVSQPSDDPLAFTQISAAQGSSDRLAAYAQTISDSTSVLNNGVSALQSVDQLLVQAKQLAQQGNNAATSDPNSVEALASQLDGLISQALQVANSKPDGKPIFGGTATGTQPFSVATTDSSGRPETIAYNGSGTAASELISPEQAVNTRYAGSAVFQQAGGDVFKALISLRDNLRNTTLTGTAREQALTQNITDLDSARTAIENVTAQQASSLATLQTVQNFNNTLKLSVDQQVGNLKGTDYAEAVVKMQENQTSLQAIYATTAQIFQTGILNFIH